MSASKLNPETQRRIYQAIRAGNYKETACQFAGISTSTLHNWIKRGEAAEGDTHNKYYHFLRGLNEAVAEAEVRNVAIVQKAAEKQWQASAWMLERRHPERWSNKQRIEMKAEIEVEESSTKKRLEGLLASIAERLREDEDGSESNGGGS